jgi:hypothetical protein
MLLSAWHEAFGEERKTVKEAIAEQSDNLRAAVEDMLSRVAHGSASPSQVSGKRQSFCQSSKRAKFGNFVSGFG